MKYAVLPDNENTLYLIKIISKGEDYIDDRTYNLFGCFLIQKRNGILLVIAIVTLISNIILRIFF